MIVTPRRARSRAMRPAMPLALVAFVTLATALGVHVEYAAGHGFTPVAVCFNCWINRRTRARVYDDGRIERIE